jgi:hypothetical protein
LDIRAVQSDAKQMQTFKDLLQREDICGSITCVSKSLQDDGVLGWVGLGETVLETSKEGCREEGGEGLVVKQDWGLLREVGH